MVREDKDKDFNPLGCHRDLIQHFLDAIVQTTINTCQNISSRLYLYINKLILQTNSFLKIVSVEYIFQCYVTFTQQSEVIYQMLTVVIFFCK